MRLRMLLGTVVCGTALLAVSACTSSIAGTATFGGPTQTSAPSTAETTAETTEASPSANSDELLACVTAGLSYISANDNFVAWAEATNSGTPTTLTRESVAGDFDSAIASVQTLLDPLPPGAIRDAVQAAQNAAGGLRDGLRAGAPVDNSGLIAAVDAVATACEL
ncbi:MAG: hypothetical protein M3381_06055 [Actinomycetota bacterium]|nr:hypothetical protein [Actinomycetota bacterium]